MTENRTLKLFYLASALDDGDRAGLPALLAGALPRATFDVAVGVLGPAAGAVGAALTAAGVPVLAVPVRNLIDFGGMRRLRRAVQSFGAGVLHAFGPDAVRAARLCLSRRGGSNVPRLVATGAADAGSGPAGWLAVRQLRRADRVVATGWAEGEAYRRLGVEGARLTRIAPAVAPPGAPPARATFCAAIGAPEGGRLIFAGGRLDAAHNIRAAVTAFDMVRYGAPHAQLVLTGGGPDRAAAEGRARALMFDDYRVRFTGARPDIAAATLLAEQVWVTCSRGGEGLALRAMAAGKPVLAYRTPELDEVVEDGVTGFLVPAGDQTALAGKAQLLLAEPELATRLGEAGRARAAERFGVERLADQHARVYQELA
ncbi:MAG: glycosyltransferase family 4 protein [Gemmata sp.]